MKLFLCLACVASMLLAPFESFAETPQVPVAKGSLKYLDARNGFLEFSFGDSPKVHPLRWFENNKEFSCYLRDDVRIWPRVGNAEIIAPVFWFHKQRLARITFGVRPGSISAMLDVLTSNYGKPSEPLKNLNPFNKDKEYYWEGDTVRVSFEAGTIYSSVTIESRAELARVKLEAANTDL